MSRRGSGEGGKYVVGRGRPPKHSRWTKGQSGNPRGRPKGAKGKHKKLLAWHEPTREMILEEAYAPLRLPTGEQIAMIKGVVRAVMKAALTGGMLAQRTILQVVSDAEARSAEAHRTLFETVRNYRDGCEAERRRCTALGITEPEFVPHPDDLYLNWETLQVEFRGPITLEGKQALDKLLEQRNMNEKAFLSFRAEAVASPDDWTLLGLAMTVQDQFDNINDGLPERYRKKLKHRMSPVEREEAVARIKAAQPRNSPHQRKSKARRTS